MNLVWSLCLIGLVGGLGAARAGPVRKTSRKNVSPQDEVNVLMFGVIQFGDSFKYISETTEAKIDRISQALKNHEGILQRLGRHAEETAEMKKQTKAVITLLQTQMAEQQAETEVAKSRLANLEQEEVELMANVKRLETHLNTYVPASSIKELQARAEEHAGVLRGLQELIQFQKESIESQSVKLTKLQKTSEGRSESRARAI